ncbi:hypothetical protein BD770DRAFT_420182 [Pilaira anomala]|nr:hypothetical protein BD770DRAFT_420182 [Pilaira anomala]
MHASPAEVFHRNLVDAVSNVEDSDENEHYVYPFSGNESSNHHLSDISTSNMHRPLSVRSTPGSLLYDLKRRQGPGGLGEWLKQAFYLKNSKIQQPIHTLDEEEDEWSSSEYSRRPKLRNNVIKNYESTHQKPDKFSILTRWHDTFVASSHDKINTKKRLPPIQQQNNSQKHPTYHYGSGIHHSCGYTSDEEDAPLLLRRHKRIPRNKKNCNRNMCRNAILFILSSIIILFLFIFYRAQPLMELTVDIGRVLATDKELIFDLKVQAENWNWWTVHVMDADISIFAFSQIVPSSLLFNTTQVKGVDPAEYLGNLVHFDEPLSIQSSAFDKCSKEAISQIRIKSPGADLSGNERWSRMIRYPYGLVVRGVLKYKPIPFTMGIYPISTAICNVTQVDPTTGSVSSDPDKSICTGQEEDDDLNIFSRLA